MEEIQEIVCAHDDLYGQKTINYNHETFEKASNIFKVLGYSERLKLLALLAEGELCVSEIAKICKDEISTVSQRLKVLRNEKIIMQRREGKHIYYKLADQHIIDLINHCLRHAEE
jgi:DNA-binding transcriptional ArsR family regulator